MSCELEKIEESRDVVISAIAQTMDIYGVTQSVGRIYGVLYFATKPLSLDEIKEEVAMSKGSVSNGLRELLDTEMVSKVWLKGERRDYYIAEKDFLKNFISFFIKNLRKERNITIKAISKVEPILQDIAENSQDNAIKKQAQNDIKLINDSMVYFDWIQRLTTLMENGEIFKLIPIDPAINEKDQE